MSSSRDAKLAGLQRCMRRRGPTVGGSVDSLPHGEQVKVLDEMSDTFVKVIGDAEAPGPIAWATYAGHRFARELDMPDIADALPFRREVTALAAE